MTLLKNYIQNPILEKSNVMKASKAAANLLQWIKAVVNVNEAILLNDPKKLELAQAEESLAVTESNLSEKQDQLKLALDLVGQLEGQC